MTAKPREGAQRLRLVLIILVIVVALPIVGGVVAYLATNDLGQAADVAAALGAVLAGGATAVAAYAALRAAEEASVTAQRATEALGLVRQPAFTVQSAADLGASYPGGPSRTVQIVNGAEWPARNVDVVVEKDGRLFAKKHFPVIGANTAVEISTDPLPSTSRIVVTVTYSDEAELLRWRLTLAQQDSEPSGAPTLERLSWPGRGSVQLY